MTTKRKPEAIHPEECGAQSASVLRNQQLGHHTPAAIQSARMSHRAIHLITSRPDIFARQGSVRPRCRGAVARKRGPYYDLIWRQNGHRHVVYLGPEGPLVEEVRHILQTLQLPLRRHRAYVQLQRSIRSALQGHKAQLDRQLRKRGLFLNGYQVRGWRGAVPR